MNQNERYTKGMQGKQSFYLYVLQRMLEIFKKRIAVNL